MSKSTKEYYKKYYRRARTQRLRKAWLERHQPRLSLINCTIFLWGY